MLEESAEESWWITTKEQVPAECHVASLLTENGGLESVFKFFQTTVLPQTCHGQCCHFCPLDFLRFVVNLVSPKWMGASLLKAEGFLSLPVHRDSLNSAHSFKAGIVPCYHWAHHTREDTLVVVWSKLCRIVH